MSDTALISLFAGVGGFDLAARNLNIPVLSAVEIDDNARGVIAHQFPETKLFTDVCEVTGKELLNGWTGNIILSGGFPCQDLSVAGKRAGLGGERSALFWQIIRLADELKPAWLVLENVPGLLSSNSGRDMGTVIGALGDLGYGIGYRVLDAQHFGVPQRRRRVFIVGHFGDNGSTSAQVLAVGESSGRNTSTRKPKRQTTTTQTTDSVAGGLLGSNIIGALCASDYKFPQQQQVHENKIIIQDTVNRLASFGEYVEDTTTSTIQSRDHKGATDLVMAHQPSVQSHHAQTFITTQTVVRRLTPTECERLQGFPDGWTAQRIDHKTGQVVEQKDSARYKQMGNAVAVPCVQWILNRIIEQK